MFFNPISEAEQASISPLGGDLGPTRLTLEQRCARLEPDYMQDQLGVAAGERGGRETDALHSEAHERAVDEHFSCFSFKVGEAASEAHCHS